MELLNRQATVLWTSTASPLLGAAGLLQNICEKHFGCSGRMSSVTSLQTWHF